ncbi:hypothetical protein OPT61_g157 [Boeremia exigua]|uniref:Uncharacterized protein n=1 Tax=Boeremia exigua TaxID=749465 RepID=A0ACC2IUZ1_9PLEO|nr:hypothetical protein OPT61_g157 [Boeremia exigua]
MAIMSTVSSTRIQNACYEVHGNVVEKQRVKPEDPYGWHVLAGQYGEEPANFTIPLYGKGMVSWTVLSNEICGPRSEEVNKISLWVCHNEVKQVADSTDATPHVDVKDSDTMINATNPLLE